MGAYSQAVEIYTLVLTAQEMAQSDQAGQKCADVIHVPNIFSSKAMVHILATAWAMVSGWKSMNFRPLLRGLGILQESMVFTVEPGIYIEKWGGVRIEDLVVLRADGVQILTNSDKRFVC